MHRLLDGTELVRPFLPTRDFDLSRRFYEAHGITIERVLTDNGTHFTTPGNTSSAAPDIKAALDAGEPLWAHAFEYACAKGDIDHRLTKPKHPWTTDEVEYPFFGAVLFSARLRMTSRRRVGLEVKARPRCLHCRSSFEAPEFRREVQHPVPI